MHVKFMESLDEGEKWRQYTSCTRSKRTRSGSDEGHLHPYIRLRILLSRADYWKSQGRKFCDFCKCWIADNKPSIEFHEGGKKHKENVGKRLREIHKTSAKQARQHRKFEDDIKKMETAAMAAYLKDVENNTTDLTAERIIREKLEKTDTTANNSTPKPPAQLATPEANPRYKNREFHPLVKDTPNRGGRGNREGREHAVDVDPCDPSSSSRPRSSAHGKSGFPSASGETKNPQGKAKVKGKKGKRGSEADGPQGNKSGGQVSSQKLWYEAVSPEGYTYYWHVQTNEAVWEAPPEGFATIAEQEEEAKEQVLQEELLAEIAKDEERKKEETAEERRANAEREKQKEIRKQREQEEKIEAAENSDDDQPNPVTYRRDYSVPERPQPYGTWKTVQVIDRKPVDLQLPKQELLQIAVPTLDREIPQRVFKEKTISRVHVGDSDEEETAPSTFKKRKFGNKNVRKRLDDD